MKNQIIIFAVALIALLSFTVVAKQLKASSDGQNRQVPSQRLNGGFAVVDL